MRRWLLAIALFLPGGLATAHAESHRLLFTGDVLLAREVQREIEARPKVSPWGALAPLFGKADWIAGNLEGAVGDPAACPADAGPQSPCFADPAALIPLLRTAGFRAMSLENNHAADLGQPGRRAAREALTAAGLGALSYEEAPAFVRLGSRTVAIVALTLVPGRDGVRAELPSLELTRKLRLAHQLADWTIVFVHWGAELQDWPSDSQISAAHWLIENGADVIVGAHPHVIEPADCVEGKPVFYSLGNHLFDQKYPETKRGLIADCRIEDDRLSCGGIATSTPAGSAFPRPATIQDDSTAAALAGCPVMAHPRLTVGSVTLGVMEKSGETATGPIVLDGSQDGRRLWDTPRRRVLTAEPARFAGEDMLFSLEQHSSPIDDETGPRPYVYRVMPSGLVAKWRGSALAWPLVDAVPVYGGNEDFLCALHRTDSFIVMNTSSRSLRTQLYRWNGFGFSAADDAAAEKLCREHYAG